MHRTSSTIGGKTIIFIVLIFACISPLMGVPLADSARTSYPNSTIGHPDTPNVFRGDKLRFIKNLSAETRLGYIFPSHPFLLSENRWGKPIRNSFSSHLKYALAFPEDNPTHKIYSDAYQGVGLAYYNFGEPEQLGTPVALYLFQGASLAKISPAFSLNYEWNFGLSGGWKPYDAETNDYNQVIGSKLNAYISIGAFARWRLSQRVDLTSGVSLTHFSNGNTKFPNAGLNLIGWNAGVSYRFTDGSKDEPRSRVSRIHPVQFPRHISYDALLFGSWRRKGVYLEERGIASPHTYTVTGFNFASMYNFSYRFRAGLSLDGIYDGSANIYTEDYIVPMGGGNPGYIFYNPPLNRQLALGISGRTEYVMPYFTVGVGVGANVLHKGGDMKGFYQIFSLKIEMTRNSFLHIGYNIKDFHEPNFLMLGIGYRFHNRYPFCHR